MWGCEENIMMKKIVKCFCIVVCLPNSALYGMTLAKYKPVEWNDDQKYCISACLDVLREDSPEKIEIENCIEWIDQIIEPLEYVKKRDDVPFEEKYRLSHLEQLKSILKRELNKLSTAHK